MHLADVGGRAHTNPTTLVLALEVVGRALPLGLALVVIDDSLLLEDTAIVGC